MNVGAGLIKVAIKPLSGNNAASSSGIAVGCWQIYGSAGRQRMVRYPFSYGSASPTVEVLDMGQKTRSAAVSLALGCVILTWLACTSETRTTQSKLPVRPQDEFAIIPLNGAKIFVNYCAACHGAHAKGNGPVAPALRTKVPDLTVLARGNRGIFPADRVRGIIAGEQSYSAHGSREMPVWGPIFHQVEYDQDWGYVRLQNVTEYIHSIQQK